MEAFGPLVVLGILVGLCWLVSRGFSRAAGAGAVRHCMTCGSDSAGKAKTKGSLLIEIVLWCCFLVPGLVYSLWRHSSRHAACSVCGSSLLVPVSSPAALAHKKQMSH